MSTNKYLCECLTTCQSEKKYIWNSWYFSLSWTMFKQRETLVWVFNYMSEKKHIWNWTRILGVFFHFYWPFYENVNQEYNLLSDCVFGLFTYRVNVAKIVCQASLPSFLTWVSLAIFHLDQCEMEVVCSP